MKKSFILFAIVFSTGYILSCNEKKSPSSIKSAAPARIKPTNAVIKPAAPNLTPQQIREQINKEIHEALSTANDSITADAITVIGETHNAIRFLLDSNYSAATKAIEKAIGKSEVITAGKPAASLVPIEREVTVRDLITDIETLHNTREQIEDFTDKGYLQNARQLINMLVSEIDINTSRLPLETYPAALRTAAALTKEKKHMDAALVLNAALNTVVINEKSIPLPLVRAELMLAAADSLMAVKNSKEEDINLLLDNANYQIRFAEELGYGKRDKEFEELYDAINDMKKEVKEKKADQRGIMSNLRNKLNAFKKRISPETQNKKS
jgi:hypothetical protein